MKTKIHTDPQAATPVKFPCIMTDDHGYVVLATSETDGTYIAVPETSGMLGEYDGNGGGEFAATWEEVGFYRATTPVTITFQP